MRQVTYVSTACGDDSYEVFRDIERQSLRNNVRSGLSGLLLFDGVRYLQILEGNSEAIEATVARIHADNRHLGVLLLADKTVECAQFGGWAMLCRDARLPTDDLGKALAPYLRDADRNTRALFESFAAIRAKAA